MDASLPKLVSAPMSRLPQRRSLLPDPRPSTPTTRPPDVSGTPTTEPKMPDGNVGERPSHVS